MQTWQQTQARYLHEAHHDARMQQYVADMQRTIGDKSQYNYDRPGTMPARDRLFPPEKKAVFDANPDIIKAVIHTNIRKVHFIIQHEVNSLNDKDVNGNTALHLASQSNSITIAACLLEEGANCNARKGKLTYWTGPL